MIAAQEALKAEYYLWQLFQIEKDMVGVRQEAGKHKEELNGAAKVLYSCESKVEQKKKAAAGFSKERLLLERKHKKRKAELEKKASSIIALLQVVACHCCCAMGVQPTLCPTHHSGGMPQCLAFVHCSG